MKQDFMEELYIYHIKKKSWRLVHIPHPDTCDKKDEHCKGFRVFKSVEFSSESDVRVQCVFLQNRDVETCTTEDRDGYKCKTVDIKSLSGKKDNDFQMVADLGLATRGDDSDNTTGWGVREYVVNVDFSQDLYCLDRLVYNLAQDVNYNESCEDNGVLDPKKFCC